MRIQNRAALTDHGNRHGRRIVADLLDCGLDAIDPYDRVKTLVKREGNRLILNDSGFEMRGDPHAGRAEYDLDEYDRIYVLGAAKGVQRAALGLEEILGSNLTGGHVIGKRGDGVQLRKIGVTLAGHPLPDRDCLEGCKRIEEIVRGLTGRDLVFTIMGSGCGSLLTYPADGISIEDVSEFTRMMQIEKGVPTSDLNVVRTHIDRFKGGRLARLLSKAKVVNLVTADPAKLGVPVLRATYFEMLAKNTFFPTVACASTFEDAIGVIRRWNAWDRTPESIRNRLLSGDPRDENLSVDEYEAMGMRFFGLIFKDATVYPAVRKRAAELGLNCLMLSEYMEAEAREAGTVNAQMALCAERLGEPFRPPVVLMTSGENVVTVGEEHSVGGRNQEYCVAAALKIAGSERIVFGAVDTDGTDGPGGLHLPGAPDCLAGAIVDGYTAQEAKNANIDLKDALLRHDTSESLWKLCCGISATPSISALDLGIILIE